MGWCSRGAKKPNSSSALSIQYVRKERRFFSLARPIGQWGVSLPELKSRMIFTTPRSVTSKNAQHRKLKNFPLEKIPDCEREIILYRPRAILWLFHFLEDLDLRGHKSSLRSRIILEIPLRNRVVNAARWLAGLMRHDLLGTIWDSWIWYLRKSRRISKFF